ncbi:MAG: 2Fe-2S iron-sulfur cluster-binding protein [Bacteroidota bacterium]
MGLFKKIFSKEEKQAEVSTTKKHKGYHTLTIESVEKVTPEAVKVTFSIPEELQANYRFTPGQYVNICVMMNGQEERRSYSICSDSSKNSSISIAIKAIHKGNVSQWANEELRAGGSLQVSVPEGNFKLGTHEKQVVAFAAGSGITPILSIAKKLEETGGKLHLFYGNKSFESIIFHEDFHTLANTEVKHFLSQEQREGFGHGRLSKEQISELIKSDLNLLKADGFFLCGPEAMISAAKEVLALFGVPKEKVHFELYTTPLAMESETPVSENNFKGKSKVSVILDDEKINFELDAKGKSILETVTNEGYDAPYSCRGGVCCTCKAKVLEGKATMTLNYSLTDEEVKQGYILTCQAHPASEKLVISYDE